MTAAKNIILGRMAPFGMCDDYFNVMRTTTNAELLSMSLPFLVYGLKTGVVDTGILDLFTQAELKTYGIFYNFSGGIGVSSTDAPNAISYQDGRELFIVNSNVTVVSTLTRTKIVGVNSGFSTTVEANTFMDTYLYNSNADVTVNSGALLNFFAENKPGYATSNISVYGKAEITLDMYTQAYISILDTLTFAKITANKKSIATVDVNETDLRIFVRAYQQAIIYYEQPAL